MSSFFRGPAPAKPPPSSTERLERMRNDLQALVRRRDALRADSGRVEAEAVRQAKAGHTNAARQLLVEKKRLTDDLTRLGGTISNLQQQVSTIEMAQAQASVAQSMRDGAALMAEVEQSLDADQLHRDLVDMRTRARNVDQVTRLMARPLFGGGDFTDASETDAIDDELQRLMAQSALVDADSGAAHQETALAVGLGVHESALDPRQIERDMGL